MRQKIIRVGNSAAVTIPKEFLNKINWQIGDEVQFESEPENGRFIIRDADFNGKISQNNLTPEFKQWLDKFTTKHKDLLKELART